MDTDALAVDVIASVMGNSRNFLGQKHTMKFLKSGETFMTRSAERGSWESWLSSGKSGLVERAQVEAERFLREHHVPPLEDIQKRELDQLMSAAQKELVK